ncbi:MAG: MaoC family dehydratase N-terminal domain-containing protein [Deltaproteobacteria bacterium]|nr:MaoC family dehydratase N-terminal domain-containing protein [Deltaproteobacteria bacterium]
MLTTLDRSVIGRRSEPITYEIDESEIRRFAEAVAARDAIHFDRDAARAAGFSGVVAPPTFPIALRPRDVRDGLGIDMRKLLHGEQEFRFERPIVAGDRISVVGEIVDVGEKVGKSGVMKSLTVAVRGVDAANRLVFESCSTVLIRS